MLLNSELSHGSNDVMPDSFDSLLKKGTELFEVYSSKDSSVRRLSEAVKRNNSKEHDAQKADEIFQEIVDNDVKQLGHIMERFRQKAKRTKS